MKFYRLESKETKVGPYQTLTSRDRCLIAVRMSEILDINLFSGLCPSPFEDGSLRELTHDKGSFFYGFSKLKFLKDWFIQDSENKNVERVIDF